MLLSKQGAKLKKKLISLHIYNNLNNKILTICENNYLISLIFARRIRNMTQ